MSDNPTEIQFRSEQELRDWLHAKDRDWQCALATRAVLRALPLIFRVLDLPTRELPAKKEKKLALQSLRITLLAWVTVKHGLYGNLGVALEQSLLDLLQHLSVAQEQSPEHHVATSVAKLGGLILGAPSEIDTSSKIVFWEANTTTFVMSDVFTATEADKNAKRQLLDSISKDANFLKSDRDAASLMRQNLWLNEVRDKPELKVNFPDWARAVFDKFANSKLGKESSWAEWSQWYRSILGYPAKQTKSYFGDTVEIDLALRDGSFWDGDPDDVMLRIENLRKAGSKGRQIGVLEFAKVASNADGNEGHALNDHNRKSKNSSPTVRVDAVTTHADLPTLFDELGRRPFARALVERMDKARADGNNGLAVHLHAPWGAGKTSVLLMMAEIMTEKRGNKPEDHRWITVDFNAWQHEPRKALWWPFLETVKSDSIRRLQSQKKFGRALRVWRKWVFWNTAIVSARYIAPLLILLIVAATGWGITQDKTTETLVSNLTNLLGVIVSAAAVFGIAAMFGRILAFGSEANARDFAEHTHNPLKPMIALFDSIVRIADAPICVFIDDVDRCHASYIVGLLGAIQSSFRHRNVSFVIAADRTWMKAAFEDQYSDFVDEVGSTSQPLGHLFLEKIFQISIPVPGIDPALKRQYWERLLEAEGPRNADKAQMDDHKKKMPQTAEEFESSVEKRRLILRKKFPQGITQHDVEAELSTDSTVESRAAVVLELGNSNAAEKQAEHLLARFVDILPDNPRVMKRMVNTFAMRRAIGILQDASVEPEVLARWTILEQRFPALADKLAARPEALDEFLASSGQQGPVALTEELSHFKGIPIIEIIGPNGDNPITSDDIRRITMGARN